MYPGECLAEGHPCDASPQKNSNKIAKKIAQIFYLNYNFFGKPFCKTIILTTVVVVVLQFSPSFSSFFFFCFSLFFFVVVLQNFLQARTCRYERENTRILRVQGQCRLQKQHGQKRTRQLSNARYKATRTEASTRL